MKLPIYIFIKLPRHAPCPTDWHMLRPGAKNYGEICKKCGWKTMPTISTLRPVKFFNRYWNH